MLLKEVRLEPNSLIGADGLIPVLDLSHKDNAIAILWSYSEPVVLVEHVHLHLTVGVAVEGVVDIFSKDLMIERVFQR